MSGLANSIQHSFCPQCLQSRSGWHPSQVELALKKDLNFLDFFLSVKNTTLPSNGITNTLFRAKYE